MPADGKPTAPIFVVGHPRSGTTLLRLILNAHSRIVIPPEAHIASFLRRLKRKYGDLRSDVTMKRVAERIADKERMREWGFPREQMIEALVAAPSRDAAGLFRALMSLWTEQENKPRWGEKTPGTYRFLPEVNAWFPDCKVIHIVRDGRDVAISCLTPPFSDNYDKGNVYEVAVRWRHAIHACRKAQRDFLGNDRYLELRYEDLTDDAETKVREICAFLGEDFEPAMLDFHKSSKRNVARGDASFHARTAQQVNKGRVERWRSEADEAFVCGFEGVAGEQLRDFGYSMSGYTPPGDQRLRILWEKWRPRRLMHNYKPADGSSPDLRKGQRVDPASKG
ncbi:MAG: sulfotransferase [Planctomycetota bacterium]|nr:MAG: sulfotransferase [Planctomycetota bacterium]